MYHPLLAPLLRQPARDKTIKLWDLHEGKYLRSFKGHTDVVTQIKILENNKIAISASEDGTIRIWNINNGKLVRTMSDNGIPINKIIIIPTRHEALSLSSVGFGIQANFPQFSAVTLWNLIEGKKLCSFSGDFLFMDFAYFLEEDIVLIGDSIGNIHSLKIVNSL